MKVVPFKDKKHSVLVNLYSMPDTWLLSCFGMLTCPTQTKHYYVTNALVLIKFINTILHLIILS